MAYLLWNRNVLRMLRKFYDYLGITITFIGLYLCVLAKKHVQLFYILL